jgi:hypothetical protein
LLVVVLVVLQTRVRVLLAVAVEQVVTGRPF